MIRKTNKRIITILLLVVCFGIGYAALNVSLSIEGVANVDKNTWDVHIENIKVKEGSVEAIKAPTVTDGISLEFEIPLNLPGDYYEFTFDVVNKGTIDAMLSDFTVDSNFESAMAEYLYIITSYENNIEAEIGQMIKSNDFVRFKGYFKYRDDIEIDDLPTENIVFHINIDFTYSQADEYAYEVFNKGVKSELKMISGDFETPGSEFCLGEECFYVLGIEDDYIGTLAKYNLNVGNKVTYFDFDKVEYEPLENPTGIQSPSAKGVDIDFEKQEIHYPFIGCYPYSKNNDTNYYNSDIYNVVENYGKYITNLGYQTYWQGLVRKRFLEMGCDLENETCENVGYPALYSSSYWLELEDDNGDVYGMLIGGKLSAADPSNEFTFGVRPMVSFHKDVLLGN